ncbi:MAG: endonuclease/exonuclease/phosphatase family protein, partial [Opitutales bacterium]
SHRRDYAVWIFSDHGQEETTPFAREQGRPLQDVVAEILQEPPPVIPIRSEEKVGIRSNRGYWGERRKEVPQTPLSTGGNEPGPKQLKLIIAAMGPLGHVYYDKPMTLAEKMKHARNLVARGGIPLVFFLDEKGNVYVADAEDSHQLPAEIATVIGNDHPFQEEIATDLIRICRHEHAGDFILSGWRWDKKALSFPEENGAHAGPGVNETHGFILLPPATLVGASPGKYLRGEVVRAAALHHLKRTFLPPEVHFPEIRGSKDSLRILTYNIHSCIGMDGRISPERIARVIAQHQPDIVALQEVDVGRRRTHRIDQAHVIAECMKMNYHFHPAFEIEEEQYGLALLSHYPMTHIKAGRLPGLSHRPRREPRGALLVEIAYHDRGIRLLNTHLGLSSKERRAQVTALMSEQWLHELEDDVPLIICGDMNAGPSSFPHLCLSRRFFDVQALLESHTPMNTFFARNPMLRLDHVFVSSHFQVLSVDVARTDLTRVASDHLPLLTEVKLVSENEPARAL